MTDRVQSLIDNIDKILELTTTQNRKIEELTAEVKALKNRINLLSGPEQPVKTEETKNKVDDILELSLEELFTALFQEALNPKSCSPQKVYVTARPQRYKGQP